MPVKCPNCGYENADEALSCNLCQRVLRKEKPAAPPPAAGEDREAQFKALLDEGIRALMTPGKQEHGAACLEKARAMIPDPPVTERDRARRNRIDVLIEAGRGMPKGGPPPQAAPEAAELKPEDASAWLNQALCHLELKRGAEALACCEKALGLTPLSPNAWYTKGSILLELLGRGPEAAACFDEVLGLKPDFHWALYKKALALDKAGETAPALAAFEKFIGAAPPPMGAQIEAARRRAEELRKAG